MSKYESGILKGIAIVLMLVHHLFTEEIIYTEMDIEFMWLNQNKMMYLGSVCKVCVALFVFISAYGLTKQLKINGVNIRSELYYSRRILKIYLPYLFIYIIAFFVSICAGRMTLYYGTEWSHASYYILLDAIGAPGIMGTPTLNGTWWYMSYAMLLPMIAAMIFFLKKNYGNVVTLILAVLIPAWLNISEISAIRWYMLTVVLGVVSAYDDWLENINKKVNKNIILYLAYLFLMAVLVAVMSYIRFWVGAYWLTEAILTFLIANFAIAFGKIKALGNIFYFLGKHSMNIFLTHSFIFYSTFPPIK